MDELLRIEGLEVAYRDGDRRVHAVGGVDLALAPGRVLAIVGESGSGKTTLALSVLNLLPSNARIGRGRVVFEGQDLLALKGEALRAVRGRRISMIFQDPVSGLNPVNSIGSQVAEIIQTHLSVSKKDARRMTLEALGAQGLTPAQRVAESFPFHLSGGMCQRVMIAIATVLRPSLIIADEPTSALDVTMQAAILQELDDLRQRTGTAILLITHDLGVVASMADEVAVMYAGRIVEHGQTAAVYARPQHPYTAALLAARPRLDDPGRVLTTIKGTPPDLAALTGECAFLPRCTKAVSACRTEAWPPLRDLAESQRAACFNPMFYAES
jgi:oligopeptide/dipeptide ABC transporter ATP-binding protein